MTWRTSIGERTLEGSEAALIRSGLSSVADMVTVWICDDADALQFGIPVFDRLQPLAKLAVLVDVGWALLRETESCPQLTAISEAAVATIFRGIEDGVHGEIDTQDDEDVTEPFFWRRLILDAVRENGETEDLPSSDCTDYDEWEILIQGLSDRILWDNDFCSDEPFLDAAPQKAQEIRREMGIDDSYFRFVPPDPQPGELPAIQATLHQLVGRWTGDQNDSTCQSPE